MIGLAFGVYQSDYKEMRLLDIPNTIRICHTCHTLPGDHMTPENNFRGPETVGFVKVQG